MRWRNSFACYLSIAAIGILFVGCNLRKSEREDDRVALGVSMSTFASPYASATVRQFRRYAQEMGVELIMLDAQLDIQSEAYNIENLMLMQVDAILVNVVDSKGSRAALKQAAAAGFPVVCFNSTVDQPETLGIRAYTGPEYYQQGVTAARVAMRLKADARAVMITGTPGYSAAIDREKGFINTIVAEGDTVKMLDIQTANWMREDAQRIMSDYITMYGDAIDLVYCQDDNMAAGAVNALRMAGYSIGTRPFVVSIGAMMDGLPLVTQGWIDSTVMQSPLEECQLAVDTALALLEGRQMEPFKSRFMQTPPVDQTNVQQVIDLRLWD